MSENIREPGPSRIMHEQLASIVKNDCNPRLMQPVTGFYGNSKKK